MTTLIREKIDHRHPIVIRTRHMGEVWEVRHDHVVKDIAQARFNYPNDEYPTLRTHLNEPEPTIAVQGRDGQTYYPDIVVVEFPHNVLQIIAEVEMEDTATKPETADKWAAYADITKSFYLYVPFEVVNDVRRILRKRKIDVAGLRSWRYIVGYKTIEVEDVYSRQDLIATLMPKFLIPKPIRKRLYVDNALSS